MIRVLPDVRRALDAGEAVVALESSVLAQGLPIPENAVAARRMTAAVEGAGASPAITAVARGVATGGIGGVHRRLPGARSAARDESADLLELAGTPMVVVCSGAKVILDLPATWERIDTLGIPVLGVGTDELPGFYTARTGIPLGVRAANALEVAAIASAHFALGRRQAVLVVQPPPAAVALDPIEVERAVEIALEEAAQNDVSGGAVTPFLLASLARQSGRKTLDANLALLEANARLAAEIAVALGSG